MNVPHFDLKTQRAGLRDRGSAKRDYHDVVGYNSRMDRPKGAVLLVKLKHLDEWTQNRQAFSALYRQLLAGTRVDLP